MILIGISELISSGDILGEPGRDYSDSSLTLSTSDLIGNEKNALNSLEKLITKKYQDYSDPSKYKDPEDLAGFQTLCETNIPIWFNTLLKEREFCDTDQS